MKTIFILILGTIITLQAPQIIKLKKYYRGYGAIFGQEYKYPFANSNYKAPFTPSIKQIENAENLFLSNYYDHRTRVLKSFNSDYKINPKLRDAEKVKRKFFKYNRQYAGYVNDSNDSIIYIGLLNFANSKKASLYFEDWDQTLFHGTGEFYQKNQEFYLINLNLKNITNR